MVLAFCKAFFTADNPIKSGYIQEGEFRSSYAELIIPTLEGDMIAKLGDYMTPMSKINIIQEDCDYVSFVLLL